MSKYLDSVTRMQLEAEFGAHADEVLNNGWLPQQELQHVLQLGLQQTPHTTPHQDKPYRPEWNDMDSYLEAIYSLQQQ